MLNKEYKSISEIIKDSAELNVIKQTADEYGVVNRFEEIFPELSKVAKPEKIESGFLTVKVENSVWRSELLYQKENLINKINSFFNKKIVTNIKFK
ncbi:MAG: hypothetical protein CMF23_04885 [Ignavibacteriae bacterium]|nr:hypothetical protein [Ignavibacteriota bacterium]